MCKWSVFGRPIEQWRAVLSVCYEEVVKILLTPVLITPELFSVQPREQFPPCEKDVLILSSRSGSSEKLINESSVAIVIIEFVGGGLVSQNLLSGENDKAAPSIGASLQM
jgi:hypothetical protein